MSFRTSALGIDTCTYHDPGPRFDAARIEAHATNPLPLFPLQNSALSELSIFLSFPVLCDRSDYASHILHLPLSLTYCHVNLSMVMLVVWMPSLSPFSFVSFGWLLFLLLFSPLLPAHT